MRSESRFLVEKGQYFLTYGTDPEFFPIVRDEGRLMYTDQAGGQGRIAVFPGMFHGPIGLAVESGNDVSAQDPSCWDAVEEAVIVGQDDDLRAIPLVGVPELETDPAPVPLEPGRIYRLRLHGRGMRAAAEVQESPWAAMLLEHHLLQIRPA